MSTSTSEGYSVIVCHSAEDEIYYAHIPTLGIVTQGDNVEHAFEMAEEAISLRVELARNSGETLPVEDQPAQVRLVAIQPFLDNVPVRLSAM